MLFPILIFVTMSVASSWNKIMPAANPTPLFVKLAFFFLNQQGEEVYWDRELARVIDSHSKVALYDSTQISYLKEFFILLAICNTVVVSRRNPTLPESNRNSGRTDETDLSCNADSDRVPLDLSECHTTRNHLTPDYGSTLAGTRDHIAVRENLAVSATPVKNSLGTLPKRPSGSSLIESVEASGELSEVIYEAESPDEAALVKAASLYGYRLLSRSPDKVTLLIPGEGEITYEVLHVLPFDSLRKRMSIVVRRQDDSSIVVYCKGADSTVLPKLDRSSRQFVADEVDAGDGQSGTKHDSLVEETVNHLDLYARDGLRTLCMARRVSVLLETDRKVSSYWLYLVNAKTRKHTPV